MLAAGMRCAFPRQAEPGYRPYTWEENAMDKDRIGGSMKEGVGKVQEGWGDATDNPETEAEGKEKQAEGKLQRGWGEAKDTVRDAVRDVTDDADDEDGKV
jgi:uncharacterized protein YjbJ (UPF0337 family)